MKALHDPKYRLAAARMREELAKRESLAEAVVLLEQIGQRQDLAQ